MAEDYSPNSDPLGAFLATSPYGSHREMERIKGDEYGLATCRQHGWRVAEMARVIKAGFKALPKEATRWPYGPTGGIKETTWEVKGGKR